MRELRADLRQWLQLIIARHGAEAALMLYPEDDRAWQFFDEVDSHGFDLLPSREGELGQLRAETLPLFIRCPTPDQRRFLAALLNTSFYMTVLTIDPEAKQLVQAQMGGQRIYLDTNFLYAVLGAPPDEVYSSRRLVQRERDAAESDQRIKTMERRVVEVEEGKKHRRRIGVATLLIVLGVAVALFLSLAVFTNPWAIGGSVIGGVALTLVGLRILAGKKWGDEIVVWGGLIATITVIVVTVILATNK
jgi:hypothetical protein